MADNMGGPPSALNCIVDDSALLAGLGEDSKEDLKQWVRNGVINLFVPLYSESHSYLTACIKSEIPSALEKLNQLRGSAPPTNLNARQTLEWLDEITTSTEGQPVGRVELQGPDDQYKSWREVERYLLPDTPLSSGSLDGVAEDMRGRLQIDDGWRKGATALRDASGSPTDSSSPESSPEAGRATLAEQNGSVHSRNPSQIATGGVAGTDGIPSSVRPLLNFVVWRTYHGDSTIAGSGKYILLTNERVTQRQAQKFGVRAKLLTQLSTIVSKTTPAIVPNGTPASVDKPIEPREAADEEDEEEIVFNPAQRPTSSRGRNGILPNGNAPSNAKVLDPDHFGRSPGAAPAVSPKPAPVQPHNHNPMVKPFQRGQHTQQSHRRPFEPANRGYPQQGFRGGRARGGSLRGAPHVSARGGFHVNGFGQAQQNYNKPIDPDSYARPPSMRGRANAMRRLWNPNT